MPVKSSKIPSSSQSLQLESVVLSKTRGQPYYTTLQNWLNSQQTDDATPQNCSVEMMKKIITVLQKELECLHFQQARVMILAIQHVARFQDVSSGLPVLLSSGLVEILVYAFQVTQTHISKRDHNSVDKNGADMLLETILETVNDIADYSSEGKQLTVLKFADKLMDLIVDGRIVFQVRMEAQRTLNLLLENCPGNLTQTLTEKDVVKNLMKKMAEMLSSFGDFEMQVACTEALARLVVKSKRPKFAAEWFANDAFETAFLAIRDLNFETDCRKFLNFVNDSLGTKRSVHSYPCKEAHLGGYKLLQPPDENLPDFWVDFNSASQSITLYVAEDAEDRDEDEGGMWETVTIKADQIKSYSVTKQPHSQKLHLELSVPGKDILHFCPSNQKTASVVFDANIDLTTALAASLGDEKFQESHAKSRKKASVCKVNVRVNRAEFSSVGLINGHPVSNGIYATEANQKNAKPVSSAHSTPNRPKVSIPIVPMRTPTQTTYASSPSVVSSVQGYTSSGSKRNATGQPKTPTKPHSSGTKKVKTPLQIVVADKQPHATTDTDIDGQPKPRSARKVSMSSTAAIISSRPQPKSDSGKGMLAVQEKSTKVTHLGGHETDTGSEKISRNALSEENEKQIANNPTKSLVSASKKTNASQKSKAGQLDKQMESGTYSEDSDSQTTKAKGKRGRPQRAETSLDIKESENKKGSRQTRSKKFKLYTANQALLMLEQDSQEDDGRRRSTRRKQGSSQEVEEDAASKKKESEENSKTRKTRGCKGKKTTPESSQEDFVIPSSVPGTQESFNADIIPATLPPLSGNVTSTAKRTINANVSMSSSICRSPSLSTITEESTQSRKTNSIGKTPELHQRTDEGTHPPEKTSTNTKVHADANTSKLLQKNTDEKNTTGVVNLKRQSHDSASPESPNGNKKSKANGRVKKTAAKNISPEYPVVPESQLSQQTQTRGKAKDDSQQAKATRKSRATSKRSMQSKEIQQPILSDDNDPYKFSDTESLYSLVGKQSKSKKQTASKKNNKQAPKGSRRGKAKGSQLSTQAFSPALSQESPYQSQNDFRSPVELHGLKNSKQLAGNGKGDKKTGKNGKKPRVETKGKKNKQDNMSQDDSLSDVEVMRDASAPKSSIRQKNGPISPSDDEDVYRDEQVYNFSDDLTKKLYKQKADLEKFLGTSGGRQSQTSVSKEKSSRLERSLKKSAKTGSESNSNEENGTNAMTAGRQSQRESKDTRESSDARKSLESASWRKTYAGKETTKPPQFDFSLLKFPTRTGPIPTPNMLGEESKKMKKKKTTDKSSKVPFDWDNEEREEDGSDNKLPEKNKSKSDHKKDANRNSYAASKGEEQQLETEEFDVINNGSGHSSDEDISNEKVAKNSSRSRQQEAKNDDKVTEKRKILRSESELEDVPGHEELSEEDSWGQEATHKSRGSNGQQNKEKQDRTRKGRAKQDAKKSKYGGSDTDEAELERNLLIEEQEYGQTKSVKSGKGKQRRELSRSNARKRSNSIEEEDSEGEMCDSQEEESRRIKTSKANKQQSSRKSGEVRKRGRVDMELHYTNKLQKCMPTDEDLVMSDNNELQDNFTSDEEEIILEPQSSRRKSEKARKRSKTDLENELHQKSDEGAKQQKGVRLQDKGMKKSQRSLPTDLDSPDSDVLPDFIYNSDEAINDAPRVEDKRRQQKTKVQKGTRETKGVRPQNKEMKKSQRNLPTDLDSLDSDVVPEDLIYNSDEEINNAPRVEDKRKQQKTKLQKGTRKTTSDQPQNKDKKKSQKNLQADVDSLDSDVLPEDYIYNSDGEIKNASRVEDKRRQQTTKPKKGTGKTRSVHPHNKEMKKSQRSLQTDQDSQDSDVIYNSDEEIKNAPRAKQQKTKASVKSLGKTAKSRQPVEKSASSNKQKKGHHSSMFGSQIIEAESDEIEEEQGNTNRKEDKEFDRETVASVESFHDLCKKLLQHSGGGIGATRSRRHVPKVNYKEPENSEIESSLSGSSSSTTQSTSIASTSGPKAKQTKRGAKAPKGPVEEPLPSTSKRRKFDDTQSTISNRSWLVEKPKQKVTTYSKTRAQQWIGVGPPVNLDTLSAKKTMTKSCTTGAARQRAPPALPKKPKRPPVQSDDEEDNTYIYYYREEEKATKVVVKDDQPTTSNNKAKKSSRSRRPTENQPDEEEDEELEDLEIMRSQQSRHSATPISSALLDYNSACEDIDLYPMTPMSMHEAEEMPMSQNSIAITPRNDGTPMSGRTPKLVTFEDDIDEAIEQDPIAEEELLVSGPALGPRPTKSALKRKYAYLSEESEDDISEEAEDVVDVRKRRKSSDQLHQEDGNVSLGQGILKPKNLFMSSFTTVLQRERESLALNDIDDNVAMAEEAASSDALSSWGSYNSDSAPMLQMTQMMKVIGESVKDKMRRKQTNAQQLTETTIKTAQKQVSKMWAGQHKARRNAQEEFQDKLLSQIVGLESDLSEMENSLHKSQALLQQHQHKVAGTLMTNVKKLHKLETDYRKEGDTLEVELGQHLVRNVKGLLRQGLADMQKKMVQDTQHHEIQSVKRSLQSFLL